MEEKDLKRIFSKNLIYWLNERNKTQADLYKKMNVSSATASDWCNEKIIPRVDKLVIIADWLNIELSDLLENKKSIISTTKNDFPLSNLEKDIILKFRTFNNSERAMFLRTIGIEEKETDVSRVG